jgi:RNA polymerase sigma-70 factor (ECF subfamily)
MEEMKISATIKDCLNGKKESFTFIVEDFQERIHRFCFHLLGSVEDAKDATSEVFMKAFIHLARFDESRSFSNWLFTIAYNHCVDILRKRKRERKSLQAQFSSRPDVIRQKPEIESGYIDRLEKERLNRAIKKLPPKYLTSLLLRYQFELPYADIAQVMDKPVSSVRLLIFRGKKELRKIMEQGA